MGRQTHDDDGTRGEKCIRYNVPSNADKAAEYDSTAGYGLYVGGVAVFFERIREDGSGYTFLKYDAEVAYVTGDECDISPLVAMEKAKENPGEKIRFADPRTPTEADR